MQPLDIISGALRSIGALESGEQPDAPMANDALVLLNDMLASWSNEKMFVSYTSEVTANLTGGVYQYTIGPGGTLNTSLTGSIAGFVLTVTAVNSGAIALGQTISGAGIAQGTTISSFGTGAGGQGTAAIGTYNLSTSQTVGSEAITAYYQRPLRINSGFTRVSGIDYPLSVISLEDYETIGLKALNGPWPKAVYYQPAEPLGNVIFWPNPSSGEVHLFCDTVLQSFNTTADVIQLPQGYNLAMRFSLAELLMPEYGKADADEIAKIEKIAAKARANIKRMNMQPQQLATFSPDIVNGRRIDAGWFMHGGFN